MILRPFLLLVFLGLLACRQEKPTAPINQPSLVVPIEVNLDTMTQEEEIIAEPEPVFTIDYDTTQWLELAYLDASLDIDLKYATTDNFVEEQMYECGRCFLRPEVAKAVVNIQQQLQEKGLGLKLLDCYRPRPIQQKLWDKVPNPSYVTPPKKGSMHNRGRAVDLTLTDSLGNELDMGTPFDFFGPRAHHTCTELPDSILQRRLLLKGIMEKNGFRSIRTEWWHYYFATGKYALDDWLWECDEH